MRCAIAVVMLLMSPPLAAQDLSSIPFHSSRMLLARTSPPAQGPSGKGDRVWVWGEHPSLRAGRWLRIDFRARFQGDVRRSDALIVKEGEGALDIARRRVGIEGRLLNDIDFQIERELHRDDPWRDVYINYGPSNAIEVQGGRFKLPFSLEENVSATNLDFIYRSRIATKLSPGRDRGVMVHGRVLKQVLVYEAGLFEHDGDNARVASGTRVFAGRTKAGRLTVEPWRSSKSPLSDLRVGLAFTGGVVPTGFPGLRGRTPLGASFYQSEVWVNGNRRRTGIELRWRPGPFSVQSEYIRATDERRGQSVEDTDLSALVADGWYVGGTWALTGESKSRGLDNPRRPFLRGGSGAVEVAARVEALRFGSAEQNGVPSSSPRADVILGNSDRALTLGVNWYLNRWVKIQGNLIREDIEDPAQGPLPDRAGFWSRIVRFQFTL